MLSTNTSPKVNVVIRTFNEENWVKHCLNHCIKQAYDNFVITVVDSGSTDATLAVVQNFIVKYPEKITLKEVDVFRPGNAINLGASATISEYFICISAHCIPESSEWITAYVEFMESHIDIAGAYGRQLPLSCTQADDARDLMITFGVEQRIIEKDYFFHNANSIIRTKVWNDYPFDDDVLHVEDRAWAKEVIHAGYKIAYTPDAPVFHYHGLHQHGKKESFRAVNVLNVMNTLEGKYTFQSAYSLLGRDIDTPLVVIVPKEYEREAFVDENLSLLLEEYKDHSEIYLISNSRAGLSSGSFIHINRSNVDTKDGVPIRELMRNILAYIECNSSRVVDGLIFYDIGYRYLNLKLGKKCKELLFDQWLPAVMPAWRDYGNYWIQRGAGFENIQSSYGPRDEKPSLYRTVLGQGSVIRASELRLASNELSIGEVIWTEDISLLIKGEEGA